MNKSQKLLSRINESLDISEASNGPTEVYNSIKDYIKVASDGLTKDESNELQFEGDLIKHFGNSKVSMYNTEESSRPFELLSDKFKESKKLWNHPRVGYGKLGTVDGKKAFLMYDMGYGALFIAS